MGGGRTDGRTRPNASAACTSDGGAEQKLDKTVRMTIECENL